jgi:heat shock transcription factor
MQQSTPDRKPPAEQRANLQQQTAVPFAQIPETSDYSACNFQNPYAVDQTFPDSSFVDGLGQTQPLRFNATIPPSSSTDLVRRTPNLNGQQEQWNGVLGATEQSQEEDEEDLNMKVAMAKRDAQGKRKQIPPFVQKLSRCVYPHW